MRRRETPPAVCLNPLALPRAELLKLRMGKWGDGTRSPVRFEFVADGGRVTLHFFGDAGSVTRGLTLLEVRKLARGLGAVLAAHDAWKKAERRRS